MIFSIIGGGMPRLNMTSTFLNSSRSNEPLASSSSVRKARRSSPKRVVIFSCRILNQYDTSSSFGPAFMSAKVVMSMPPSALSTSIGLFLRRIGSSSGAKPPGPRRGGGGRLL